MSARWSRLLRLIGLVGLLLMLLPSGFVPAAALAAGGSGPTPSGPLPPGGGEVSPPLGQSTGSVALMLEMNEDSSGATYNTATAQGASESDAGQQARAQKARNEGVQQQTLNALRGAVPGATVLYQVQTAYNGIAVQADASAVPQLAALPGVRAVHLIPLLSRDNAASVPLIGAPAAWASYGATGQGIRIGIIDTGIDYIHTNFGGSGTAADYAAARTAANNTTGTSLPITNGGPALFPSAKVAGGYDFAGDDYTGASNGSGSVPVPDKNPLDCNGHGSHVAGTAAGYGVNANGTTYTGPYDNTVPFDTMRIGPGVAPGARLYALRVFGCDGSTSLTTAAINWAVDPNGDGDPSDHLDVINMSLGSSFGTKNDPSAVATDRAASLGVLVAVSAGNSGDVYYVSGSPGSAQRALTVASSVDSTDTVDGFLANGTVHPATRSANYNWASPPAANPVPVTRNLYYPATNQYGCAAWDATEAAKISNMIVLVDWKKATDTTFPCGSVARSNNAAAAGAKGIIMVDSSTPYFETSISGNNLIPAMYTSKGTGDALFPLLTAGTPSSVSATLTTAYFNATKLVVPARNDTLSTFTSRGPSGGDNGLKPDISAPGQTIFSTNSGTGNEGESLSGTSMAAPHMAGVLALLRQRRGGWTTEEIKALAMNTAGHDLYTGDSHSGTAYGPARVGAGRVDVLAAMTNTVVAYVDDGSGQVGVSFGAVEVAGTLTQTRTVRVSNKGTTAATYTLGYGARTAIPGVAYDFPDGNTITVASGQSATFRVRLTATAAQMTNAHDLTVAETQGGYSRQWLNEASGLITLTPSSGTTLRVPVYAVARPASAMTTTQPQLVFPNATGSAALGLSGQGVGNGANAPAAHTSIVTALELAATSDPLTLPAGTAPSARAADLKAVGVSTARTNTANAARLNNSTIYFGVATYGNWAAPSSEAEFDIYIDVNRDGIDDYRLYNTRLTVAGSPIDTFVTGLYRIATDTTTAQGYTNVLSSQQPTAIFNNSVLVLPVNVTGTNGGINFGAAPSTRFNYRIDTYDDQGVLRDTTGSLTYDYANPGLDFTDATSPTPLFFDLPGGTIPATFNQAAFAANGPTADPASGPKGALLLHHYNIGGARDQVVPVRLTRTLTFTPPATKAYGDAPFVVTATSAPGGTPTITSLTTAVCTIDGTNTVTILVTGACTLRAEVADDGTYAVARVEATITVGKGAQTITFAPLADRTYGDPPFTVSATASSGLTVAFTASGACVANGANGATITLTGAGSCTVTAAQAGNGNYEAAPPVARTFQVVSSASPSPSPSASPSPSVPHTVTLTISGPGTATPGGGVYSGTATFTAIPGSGAVFIGWTVDGTFVGFANPLVLPVTRDRAVVATFAAQVAFTDVPGGSPYAEAIGQLAARGILRGPGDGTARPSDTLLRAQIAGLLVRLAGWDAETSSNPFRDRCDATGANCIDPALWNEVAVLSFHNVARGFPDNVYQPREAVIHAQVISFITRTMVAKGYWTQADADDPTIYPNIPSASGHRLDLVTFVRNAGAAPGHPANQTWADWDQAATRGWTAGILWQAYSSYFSTNSIP